MNNPIQWFNDPSRAFIEPFRLVMLRFEPLNHQPVCLENLFEKKPMDPIKAK